MNNKERCEWCLGSPIYVDYHDNEWGVPVHDDQLQFEFLVLEGAQAGLSWSTILGRREGYRKAFDGFDPTSVAAYGPDKIESLLQDGGIIRNKLKVHSAITNAQRFLEVQEEFGNFSDYIWSFQNGKPIINRWEKMEDIPANSPLSDKISKDLKQRGFKFVGSTIVYAHMQATGLVNDHKISCFRYQEIINDYPS